jgi:hypothetical protein
MFCPQPLELEEHWVNTYRLSLWGVVITVTSWTSAEVQASFDITLLSLRVCHHVLAPVRCNHSALPLDVL